MSRLRFAGEEMAKQETNLVAAMGRITGGHSRREHSDGEVQRLGSSLGRHAVTGELDDRRRADAPEVTHRMSKKLHHFKNRGSRLPTRTGRHRGQGGPRDKSNEIKEDYIMPLTINTNSAAASANYHLSRNQSALQKSLTRLSSGSRIVQPIDDAGGLAGLHETRKCGRPTWRVELQKRSKTPLLFSKFRTEFWLRPAKSSIG